VTAVKRWLDSPTADRVWRMVAGVALLLSLGIGAVQLRLTQCQARYAEVSNASQRARAEAAELDRQAQDVLFQQIAADPRNTLQKLRIYNEQRAVANAQRAENPIPPAPSTNCG
jgi:hypothetical protein